MSRVPVALFNYESGGQTASGTYDFTKLRAAFADLDETSALILFCLTDLVSWFWTVTRDFTKIACARRRWGGPAVGGVGDRGGLRRLSVRAGGPA